MGIIAKTIKEFYKSRGFLVEIKPIRNLSQSKAVEIVRPFADFAPWNLDQEFLNCFDIIKNHTLVDKYRCFELWQLLGDTIKKVKGDVLEVGVWRGGTGVLMSEKAKLMDQNVKVYLADTFEGVVKASDKDSFYSGGEHKDTNIDFVKDLLKKLNLENTEILTGIFPDQTSQFIQSESIAFCHIDVDVYQSAKEILNWVWPKIPIGGLVVFDDYGFSTCDGIVKLIEETRYWPDNVTIHNLNGHAIKIKIN